MLELGGRVHGITRGRGVNQKKQSGGFLVAANRGCNARDYTSKNPQTLNYRGIGPEQER